MMLAASSVKTVARCECWRKKSVASFCETHATSRRCGRLDRRSRKVSGKAQRAITAEAYPFLATMIPVTDDSWVVDLAGRKEGHSLSAASKLEQGSFHVRVAKVAGWGALSVTPAFVAQDSMYVPTHASRSIPLVLAFT